MNETVEENGDVRLIPEALPKEFKGIDMGLAIFMPLIGFLFWNWIAFSNLGLSIACFAAVFCLSVGFYMKKSGFSQTKRSIPYLFLTMISALQFGIFDNQFLKFFNLLFLLLIAVYWICVTTKRRLEGRLSGYVLWDILSQLFFVPFSNFSCLFAGFKRIGMKSQRGRTFFIGLLGLFIFAPILIWVIQLLMDADAIFELLIGKMSFFLSHHFLIYIVQFLLGIPVSCYLYGLFYGNVTGRYASGMSVKSVQNYIVEFRIVPKVAVFAGMTALNGIYILFFLSQGAYLLSAFDNILPQSMTYAEYARRGFFELCTISGINLVVICIAYLITQRKELNVTVQKQKERISGLRAEAAALSVLTLLLIVTGLSKMVMYIHFYGLTLLRVYTTWFMILLFVFFCIILLRQFLCFPAAKTMVVSFIVCFLILGFGNMDGQIAKYNIERYQEGTLEHLDLKSFYRLSSASAPYLHDLYLETDNLVLKRQITKILRTQIGEEKTCKDMTLQDFNYQRYRAKKLIDELGI